MWIVRLALRRPYTFVVLAVLIFIVGPLAILRTPTDIFPNIDIPVVSIVWTYNGFSAQDMANRITSNYERALTSDVDDIEHIESQSLNGVSVVKIFFHPGADINRAIAEAASNSASILRVLPPGTLPPNIITYNASTVPILQLGLSSNSLSEQQLYDLGNSQIRTQLATVQGASVPLPFGGKVRQIMVDIDPRALQAKGLAPLDVVNAVNAQNLILPGGTAKIGTKEYNVQMNGSTDTVAALNDLPVKTVAGGVVYVRDVAHVRDGYAPQTNIVRSDGKRAALLTIEKSGSTSTLTIIQQVKAMLPHIAAGLPDTLHIAALSDQSVFVKSAVIGVAREALIAACLTAMMILLFLGSWRATLIIAVSIPLAVLSSLIALAALGQTINIMTLGGLALAVGILVDDATVAIENITHHLENGEPLHDAILIGSGEIAVPTFVSTLSICIVFVPMFLLSGVARYLFVPLAEAVVFAMIASYVFSRTLIPTLAMFLMRARSRAPVTGNGPIARLVRFQAAFELRFERLRDGYRGVLAAAIGRPRRFVAIFLLLCVGSLLLVPFAGRDFFPAVDTGEIRLHLRAPTGTRIEDTASLTDQVEARVRSVIPKQELSAMLDNIGVPVSGINLTYDSSDPIGPEDADVMITLAAKHRPTAAYVASLRTTLAKDFPGVSFAFLPADIVSQILNFGLPAPIDIQIVGNKLDANRVVANRLLTQLRGVRGLVDARIQQPGDAPAINVNVDRTRAIQAGLQQRDVSQNLLIALSGSSQTTPNFWLDPRNGVSYPLMAMMPQYDIDSLQALANIPVARNGATASVALISNGSGTGAAPQNLLGALSTLSRGTQQAVVSHYNVQPVLDIFASAQGRDLGGVAADVNRLVDRIRPQLPPGASIVVRGQVQAMNDSFAGLASGMVFAIALVYLLMVVNFQSWLDPAITLSGLPGSLAGIAWMLFSTGTRLSVPALTGAILCIGIATANSILVISTARELHHAGKPPLEAALAAGFSRFRPVLMTALAMLIGMLPMALGLGDGGEQNAPLGRAVIGGLAFGTVSTLLLVPVVYGMVHAWLDRRRAARPDLGQDRHSQPATPPAAFDSDPSLPMNDTSLPPAPDQAGQPTSGHPNAADRAAPPSSSPLSGEPDAPPQKPRRRLWPFALTGLAAALLLLGIVPRLQASAALTQQTQAQRTLSVSVIAPRVAPALNELLLPGAVTPFAQASIYARTSGYLAHWSADIGAQVKSGQTLATIDAPDLDAQLRQARADEATAQANYDYAKTTAQRWQDMLKTQSVAQQDADSKSSDMQARHAMLASAQANVAHLAELVSYEKITAPFDGTITARNVDVGALVTAGGTPGASGMAGELFHIQQTGVLRVFVDVPQNDAAYLTPATGVYLSVQQYPGRRIAARVARSTGSIDPASRTLRVEVDVDNQDGALMPGAYTQVHLQLKSTSPALDLPVSALLFRPDGVTVAVVDGSGKAKLETVHIGRDFGTHVEITTGLAATDRVIDNPGDSLGTGQAVQIAPAAAG